MSVTCIYLALPVITYLPLFTHFYEKQYCHTVKPNLSGHSKIDKTKILMTDGNFMKVESIAECSSSSILQYF